MNNKINLERIIKIYDSETVEKRKQNKMKKNYSISESIKKTVALTYLVVYTAIEKYKLMKEMLI